MGGGRRHPLIEGGGRREGEGGVEEKRTKESEGQMSQGKELQKKELACERAERGREGGRREGDECELASEPYSAQGSRLPCRETEFPTASLHDT